MALFGVTLRSDEAGTRAIFSRPTDPMLVPSSETAARAWGDFAAGDDDTSDGGWWGVLREEAGVLHNADGKDVCAPTCAFCCLMTVMVPGFLEQWSFLEQVTFPEQTAFLEQAAVRSCGINRTVHPSVSQSTSSGMAADRSGIVLTEVSIFLRTRRTSCPYLRAKQISKVAADSRHTGALRRLPM